MAEVWPEDQLSADRFLGGKLQLIQPKSGYRAGIDPVLLAASVPAASGDTVLDLGCGAGAALLCLGRRVPGLSLTGLELQPSYADLARRNAALNQLGAEIVNGDLQQMPACITQRQFSHVIANPPYFDRCTGTRAQDAGREAALGEDTPLADWIASAAKRVAPKGTVTVIQRAERMPALLSAMASHLGSLEALPLIPRPGRTARLILLRGRKGGRADFKLHHGWVLHEGNSHPGDRENYTNATACVLRDGAALQFSQ
ncbi:tRNA1(Val) (adenine(37)-N6)-methyltransferase [Roseovarius aestuarii]|uniref:tRNA1(Val) (Adenine(37)-N6)-methyltransferase n=1 Tax=Roseovarius aestuarii TaxID=475083 RepID=A0A1X7BTJ9_9RHOB|nr:methyltransferase domain-containing protein [Roseovarius aestuarii]SMC12915.1 tRNA1(Val) (adenine(37)-N6)-methyltransferase [Roseovarius aestuarii]